MNLLKTPEFKVGLFILAAGVLIAVMSMKVSEEPEFLSPTQKFWFLVDDAGGLFTGSTIKLAGVSVGSIRKITLQDGLARVEIKVRSDIELTQSSYVEIRSNGMLGDRSAQIVIGDPTAPKLPRGSQIVDVRSLGSIDSIMTEVSRVTKSLGVVAENLRQASEGTDSEKPFGRIVKNLEIVTSDLAELTSSSRDELRDTLRNIHNVSEALNDFIGDDSQDGFRAAWKNASEGLSNIGRSLTNVEEITRKINSGEGTIGKLVNDDTTVHELNSAISGVNDFLGAAQRIQTSFDFHTEVHLDNDPARSFIGLKIQPGLDRYYELQVVDDSRGISRTQERKTTSGGVTTETVETQTMRHEPRFTALYAKNFDNLTVKGGLIESSGGVGLDYYLLRQRLRLSLEAFNFQDGYLRGFLRMNLFKGFYLTGGADRIARIDKVSSFVGAGLFLTNDDIKYLVSKVPF